MKCEEVIELMQRDLDGDLNPQEKKKMSYHLSSCYDCQALFDRLKNLSFQLEALPKVNPAYSIVDKVLPVLDQVDNTSGENVIDFKQNSGPKAPELKVRGFQKNKKWWIPSIAAVAVLFGVLVVMDQSSRFEMDLLSSSSQEGAYDASQNNESANTADMAGSKVTSGDNSGDNSQIFSIAPAPETASEAPEEGTSEDTVPEARTFQAPKEDSSRGESANEGLDSSDEDEAPKYVSPDDVYTAHEGLGGGDILIQKEDRAYYITKNAWEEPWEVEWIEWVSNHELYYVLYHPEQDERQYWLVNVDERTEEQLEEPYHSLENDQ